MTPTPFTLSPQAVEDVIAWMDANPDTDYVQALELAFGPVLFGFFIALEWGGG